MNSIPLSISKYIITHDKFSEKTSYSPLMVRWGNHQLVVVGTPGRDKAGHQVVVEWVCMEVELGQALVYKIKTVTLTSESTLAAACYNDKC